MGFSGNFMNNALGSSLMIYTEDPATGGFTGMLQLGGQRYNVSGVWSANAPAPNSVFYFYGSGVNTGVAGVGAALDFTTFANTTISVAVAQTGGVVTHVTAVYQLQQN